MKFSQVIRENAQNYTQAFGRLCDDEGCVCAIGLLGSVANIVNCDLITAREALSSEYSQEILSSAAHLLGKENLLDKHGTAIDFHELAVAITTANDVRHLSFLQIANELEAVGL